MLCLKGGFFFSLVQEKGSNNAAFAYSRVAFTVKGNKTKAETDGQEYCGK